MLKFVVFVAVVAALCLDYSISAPSQGLLEQKAQNEMKEDTGNEQKLYAHLRNRRQAEGVDSMEGFDGIPEMPKDKPGFFDRAAKVVMELLQRFLKWINTDDD